MNIPKDLNPNVAPQTVSVYTRHGANCPKRGSTPDQRVAAKNEKRCKCSKWIYLFHDGKDHRFSASTRSWEKAEQKKQELERELDPERAELRRLTKEKETKRVTVADAVQSYLMDAEARKLGSQTLAKRRTIFQRQLLPWVDANGILLLEDLTTSVLTRWRATWKLAAITTRNHQEILRNFFRYCIRQAWLKHNPALLLSKVQVKQCPTDYFTREEFGALLNATRSFALGQNFRGGDWSTRLRTLVLLMRWSGLRIGDAARLERSRLRGDRLLLYQAKTGTPVFVPLPPYVAEALRNVPPGREPNPRYFFWSGKGRSERAGNSWGPAFVRLFEIAALKQSDGTLKLGKSHMLRDTFAVELLLAGVPIEEVSMLLGHASIKTTEKHYAPWVLARQEKLQNSVEKSWLIQGIIASDANVSTTGIDGPFNGESPFLRKLGDQQQCAEAINLVPGASQSPDQLPLDFSAGGSSAATVGQRPVVDATSGEVENDSHIVNCLETSAEDREDGILCKFVCPPLPKQVHHNMATLGSQEIRSRRRFPYADVARMWDEGKTIKQIGTAVGRLDEGKDPTHTVRNFLRRMHQIGYKDASGHHFKLPYRGRTGISAANLMK